MQRVPTSILLPQEDDGDLLDYRRWLQSILRYKWGILGLTFAIVLAAGFWAYSLQPVYRASASILMESQDANVVSVEEVYSVAYEDYDYYQTQFEILKSRSLAERVVKALDLGNHPRFRPKPVEEEADEGFTLKSLLPAREKEAPVQLTQEERVERSQLAAIRYVSGGLSVAPVEYSYMSYIHFTSNDPKLAARIVNTVAQEFIRGDLDVRLEGTLQATEWLTERMEVLKENLRSSEQALQQFREREGLVQIEGVTGLGNNELQGLGMRLEDARRTRIEAQNIKEEVEGMSDATLEELLTIPAVLRHELIGAIKREQAGAERRVVELGKRYGVKHPKMIAARSDLTTATEDLAQEVRKVVSGISREYELALRNEEELKASWEERKNEVQDFNRIEFRLRELQREVEANRELYGIFFTRIKAVSETGGLERPHARIVDHALVPGSPFKPDKRMILLVALFVGLGLGCLIAILLDILENSVKSPDEVQDKLGAPLLGVLPRLLPGENGKLEQFWDNSRSQFAEAVRSLRTGVLLSSLDDPARIIVVTSTVPEEGKSTVALNLGSALAQMESTLVIGADLRRPSLARLADIAPNHKGLSHFVAGSADLDDCIQEVGELGLHVMPAGIVPTNPLEMISSEKFVQALEDLKKRYNRIILDSAPVHAVSDALVLASYADSVIYLVKADSTSASQARKGIESIVASNEPLTGVVLNQCDPSRSSESFGRGGYEGYGEYYQQDEKA
jgi:polysaccharide biosynthesis transport protein